MKNQITQKGYSLIELTLYLALLSLILVVLVYFFQQSIILKSKIEEKMEISDNGQFALQKIVWYLKNAETVNSPLSGESSSILSLNVSGENNNPVQIFTEDKILKVKIGNQPAIDLTNNRVEVDQLSFINNGISNSQPIIKINLELKGSNNFWTNPPLILQTSVNLNH